MNNFLQLMSMLRGGNPKQILSNIVQTQSKNNPMLGNVFGMIQNNDSKGLEEFARNLAKEKGMNYDELASNIKNQLGM